MAAVKFEKGSKEWQMFTDFWKICQKYWKVEKTDEYWQGLLKDINDFCEKYKEITLSKSLALGFLQTQEEIFKNIEQG